MALFIMVLFVVLPLSSVLLFYGVVCVTGITNVCVGIGGDVVIILRINVVVYISMVWCCAVCCFVVVGVADVVVCYVAHVVGIVVRVIVVVIYVAIGVVVVVVAIVVCGGVNVVACVVNVVCIFVVDNIAVVVNHNVVGVGVSCRM